MAKQEDPNPDDKKCPMCDGKGSAPSGKVCILCNGTGR
jgi:hypothetical protein